MHIAFCTPHLSAGTDSAGERQGIVNPPPGSPAVGSYGERKAVQAKMALTPAAQLLPVYGILGQ